MRASSSLTIDLKKLSHNFEELFQLTSNSPTIFMVKANAYGHGVNSIVDYCEKQFFNDSRLDSYGVASILEAVSLKKSIRMLKRDILVFSDIELSNPEMRKYYIEENIYPVISSIKDLETFLETKELAHTALFLKLNTGMNRLGIDEFQIDDVIDLLKKRNIKTIEHLMSHFACSYLQGHHSVAAQIDLFKKMKLKIQQAGISVNLTSFANSGAIETKLQLGCSHVRPGLMMYGPSSLMKGISPWRGKLISQLQTKIISSKMVKKNQELGYGLAKIPYDGQLLILPLGYGDGFFINYSGFKFRLLDHNAQIVGRINMDMLFVLIETEVEIKNLEDKKIILWNDQQPIIDELAQHSNSHAYQILCGLSSRIPRNYLLE